RPAAFAKTDSRGQGLRTPRIWQAAPPAAASLETVHQRDLVVGRADHKQVLADRPLDTIGDRVALVLQGAVNHHPALALRLDRETGDAARRGRDVQPARRSARDDLHHLADLVGAVGKPLGRGVVNPELWP